MAWCISLTSTNSVTLGRTFDRLAPEISLRAMQPYLPDLTDEVAERIDSQLAALPSH